MFQLNISFRIFLFVIFFSGTIHSSLPDQHEFVIDVSDTNQTYYFDEALKNSLLKILGNRETYIKNKNFFNSIDAKDFIKEYSSFDEEGTKKNRITVDAKLLRKFLISNNYNVSSEIKTTLIVWILCDRDLTSISSFNKVNEKCNSIKDKLTQVSIERNVKIIFPLLDSNDLVSFKIADRDKNNDFLYLSKRYVGDSFFYCRVTLEKESCYVPIKSQLNSNLDFSKSLNPVEAFNIVVDGVLEQYILKINSKDPIPYNINIKNISNLDEYRFVLSELEKIIILSDLKINYLSFEEINLSSLLIGNYKQLEKLFINYPSLRLENLESDKLSLIFE